MSILPELPPKLYQFSTGCGLALIVALYVYGAGAREKLLDRYEPIIRAELVQDFAKKKMLSEWDSLRVRYSIPRDTMRMSEWVKKNDSIVLALVFPLSVRIDSLETRDDSLLLERFMLKWREKNSLGVVSTQFNLLFLPGFLLFIGGLISWMIAESETERQAKKKLIITPH